MTAELVPFGKYKGQPVELLLQDKEYLDWIMAQPWVKDRYQNFYTVIINGGNNPVDTPAHNALQAKFLSDEYCWKLARIISPDAFEEYSAEGIAQKMRAIRKSIQDALSRDRQEATKKLLEAQNKLNPESLKSAAQKRVSYQNSSGIANPDWRRLSSWTRTQEDFYQELKTFAERDLNDAQTTLEKVKSVDPDSLVSFLDIDEGLVAYLSKRVFEKESIDVSFEIEFGFGCEKNESYKLFHYATPETNKSIETVSRWFARTIKYSIELKPTVGDDYPSILRQMRANGSNILVVGEYTGRGVSTELFLEFFKSQKVKVVFENQIDQMDYTPIDAFPDENEDLPT